MDKISIGVLLPSSTIFAVGKEFEKGLKDGLKPLKDSLEVELIKEFIGNGDIKITEAACNKFFNYDDVDLVTGIISNRAAASLSERFKGKKTPFVINNVGGYIPQISEFNEYMFVNSMHLWRHAWSLGYYGVKQFGKKGMFVSAVYDAGYSFSHMFYMGMQAADPESQWSFSIPPMPSAGALTDMSIVFPFLEEYEPDFVFATFCGTEAALFLDEFIARGWHHKTKLLGLPYLLDPFVPLKDDIAIYTSLPVVGVHEIKAAKAFYQLGLDTGKGIAKAALASADKNDLNREIAKLNTWFNVTCDNLTDDGQVIIVENRITAAQFDFISVNPVEWPTINLNAEQMTPLSEGAIGGWFNPYLCV